MKEVFDWHRFFGHWQKDAKLWLILMALLTLIRGVLCGVFASQMGEESGFRDVISCIIGGARFDARFALIGVAPSFLLAMFALTPRLSSLLDGLRLWVGWFFVNLTVVLGIVDIGFFYEYHDQFNQWIFGVIYDDWRSLVWTIWEDYPVVWIGFGIVGAAILSFYLLKRYLSRPFFGQVPGNWLVRLSYVLLTLFLVKAAITCTWGWHSLSRKDTAVTNDVFLNTLVYNPYYALYSTGRDFKKRKSVRGLESFIANGDIQAALKKLFPDGPALGGSRIEDWIERRVQGPGLEDQPQHVFLVVMESQDSWPMLDAYSDLELVPNLKRLAHDGIYVKSFLSAGVSTMPALNSIIMGVPDVGIETQYQPMARKAFSTAIARQFKELGYETNLFYAGYLSWRKLGELALNQGFDHVYGCTGIDKAECNAWGANDRAFYNYVYSKVNERKKPTFNLLMTSSNHPPYSIDLKKEGWAMDAIPESLKEVYDGETSLNTLGHFWYADRCLGEFVAQVEQGLPKSLFAITGDHWSRRFLNSKPTLYERKSVPLIIYGPELLKGVSSPQYMAGCHLDIAPTLIELIAPKGFTYCSMGSSVMDEAGRQIGFGANAVVMPESIWEIGGGETSKDLSELSNAFHAVGWWRIMKGSELGGSN